MTKATGLALLLGKPKGEPAPDDDNEDDGGEYEDDDEGSEDDNKETDEVADAMFDAIKNNDRDAFKEALRRFVDLDKLWDERERGE